MNAREFLSAATPRPWSRLIVGGGYNAIVRPDKTTVSFSDEANLSLIVAAVNEYEALLDLEEHARATFGSWKGKTADLLARLDAVRSGT